MAKKTTNTNIGNPALRRTRATPQAAQGVSGNTAYGGIVESKEVSPDLFGPHRYRTYGNMVSNIEIVAASTDYLLNLIARPTWSFDPANESDEAKRLAELTSKSLLVDLKTSWKRIVRRAATYRFYGFSLQEFWMEKTKKGHLAVYDIRPRPQRTIEQWDIDENGTVYAVGQRSPHDSTLRAIPRSKLLYLVNDALDDSPEGVGKFRQVVSACNRLMRYKELEGISFENDLRGMPVARVPYTALAKLVKAGKLTPADVTRITKPYEDFIKKHIIKPNMGFLMDSITYEGQGATPSQIPMFGLDTVRGQSPAAAAANAAIEREIWEIAGVFGTESLLLGKNGKGAFALSEDKTNNILMQVDNVTNEIVDQVSRDVITPMFEENGWDLDLRPIVTTNAAAYRDVVQLTEALKNISAAGGALSPDDRVINYVRKSFNAPLAPEINLNQVAAQMAAEAVGGSVGPDGQVLPPKVVKEPAGAGAGGKPAARPSGSGGTPEAKTQKVGKRRIQDDDED